MTALLDMPTSARLAELARAADGRLHGADHAFASVGIDTRKLAAGAVFFALHGKHDGHDYVARAAELGAAGAVVERIVAVDLPQIEVADTQFALQQAGAAWRQAFTAPVVGITGSNGKTTVCRMLSAILGQKSPTQNLAPVLASAGNFNNHLGVPLTLLGLRKTHNSAVIEMGANHAGEIDSLSRMARPRVGVITNAGDAHLEGFGSRDGVARAKGEIYARLASDGVAVINADDAYAGQWTATAAHCRRLYFSLTDTAAEIHAGDITIDSTGSRFRLFMPDGQARVELALPGEHNIRNALAAAAAASALGIMAPRVAAGLASAQPTTGRLQELAGPNGARIVDDSYNANPVSLNVALAWLGKQPGPRWLVLGDMAELGTASTAAHHAAGLRARTEGISRLWATGGETQPTVDSFGAGGVWFATHDPLAASLQQALADSAAKPPIVLVKGSRSARMDCIVERLVEARHGGASC